MSLPTPALFVSTSTDKPLPYLHTTLHSHPLTHKHNAPQQPGAKETVAWADFATRVPQLLEAVQGDLLAAARARYDACVETATTWDDFMAALERK